MIEEVQVKNMAYLSHISTKKRTTMDRDEP
jgi:hypothetical protein